MVGSSLKPDSMSMKFEAIRRIRGLGMKSPVSHWVLGLFAARGSELSV